MLTDRITTVISYIETFPHSVFTFYGKPSARGL